MHVHGKLGERRAGGSRGVGGRDMKRKPLGERPQAIRDAVAKTTVAGERSVEIEDRRR